MGRTNIDIDDKLIGRVMERYDFRSKREAVDSALRQLDVTPYSPGEILQLEGSGWDGDLDEMRTDRGVVKEWIDRG